MIATFGDAGTALPTDHAAMRKEKPKMKNKKSKTDEEKKIKPEELTDEQTNGASGGVQAGLITSGGSGEFGPKKQEESPKQKQPSWF